MDNAHAAGVGIEILLLGIGVFITLVLGIFNLMWGGGILRQKEKVIIREPTIEVSVVERDSKIERIFIQSSFKLARIGGEQDIYFESGFLQLSKGLSEELNSYFRIPSQARISWEYRIYYGIEEAEYRTLRINEPREFSITESFDAKNSLRSLEEEVREARTDVEIEEKRGRIESLKEQAQKLGGKYIVLWIDGKGKQRQYRVPKKWLSKFLPEKLWWKVG